MRVPIKRPLRAVQNDQERPSGLCWAPGRVPGAVLGSPQRDPLGLCQGIGVRPSGLCQGPHGEMLGAVPGSLGRDPSGLSWHPCACARIFRETPQGCARSPEEMFGAWSPGRAPRAVPGSQTEHPVPIPWLWGCPHLLSCSISTILIHFSTFPPIFPLPSLWGCTFRVNFAGSVVAPCCMSAAWGLPVCY